MGLQPEDREALKTVLAVGAIGLLATVVRLASDPPQTVARLVWMLLGGLGLASGGWLIATAAGMDGWGAMAAAWCAGALGAETVLLIVRRLIDRRLPPA